jgi:hypothetical protein
MEQPVTSVPSLTTAVTATGRMGMDDIHGPCERVKKVVRQPEVTRVRVRKAGSRQSLEDHGTKTTTTSESDAVGAFDATAEIAKSLAALHASHERLEARFAALKRHTLEQAASYKDEQTTRMEAVDAADDESADVRDIATICGRTRIERAKIVPSQRSSSRALCSL